MLGRGEVRGQRDEDRRYDQHEQTATGDAGPDRSAGEREIRFHGILRQVGGFHL